MSHVNMILTRVDMLVSCDLRKSAESLCCVYLTSKAGLNHRAIDSSQHIALLEKREYDSQPIDERSHAYRS